MAVTALSWWLTADDERCEVCLQGYAYEVEVRCADCDRPSCPHCAVRVTRRPALLCTDCSCAEEEA